MATKSTPNVPRFHVDPADLEKRTNVIKQIVRDLPGHVATLKAANLPTDKESIEGLAVYDDPAKWRKKILVDDYQSYISALPPSLPYAEKERIYKIYKSLHDTTARAVDDIAQYFEQGLRLKADTAAADGWSVDTETMEAEATAAATFEIDTAKFGEYYTALETAANALAKAKKLEVEHGLMWCFSRANLAAYIFGDVRPDGSAYELTPEVVLNMVKHTYRVK